MDGPKKRGEKFCLFIIRQIAAGLSPVTDIIIIIIMGIGNLSPAVLLVNALLVLCLNTWPCLVAKNFTKFFNISRHIESLDTCMKH
jgi:hypothetical protein